MKRPISRRGTDMSTAHREPKQEQGQIIVLFVLAIVVIMGFAALVIDVGVLRNANQNLWNALDAGALAGASQLPACPRAGPRATNASDIALQYADDNFPGGLPAGVTVGFRCVVGSAGGMPRASDIPAVCDPGAERLVDLQRHDLLIGLRARRGRHLQHDRAGEHGDRRATTSVERSVSNPGRRTSCRPPARDRAERNHRAPPSILCSSSTGRASMSGVDTRTPRTPPRRSARRTTQRSSGSAFGMLGPSQTGGRLRHAAGRLDRYGQLPG